MSLKIIDCAGVNFDSKEEKIINDAYNKAIGTMSHKQALFFAANKYLEVVNTELNNLKEVIGQEKSEISQAEMTKEVDPNLQAIRDLEEYQEYISLKNQNKTYISEVLSWFITAYVDIAKDPYITKGNHNDITSGVTFMLIRAGAPLEWVNSFIGQDSLKDYVKFQKLNEGTFGSSQRTQAFEAVKSKYLALAASKFKGKKADKKNYEIDMTEKLESIRGLGPAIRENPAFTTEKMEGHMLGKKDTLEYYEHQLMYLYAFNGYNDLAMPFNNSVIYSKADVNGAPNSVANLMSYNDGLAKVQRATVPGTDVPLFNNFDKKFSETFLGVKHENSVDVVDKIFQQEFATYSENIGKPILKSFLAHFTPFTKNKKAKMEKIEKALYGYMVSSSSLIRAESEEEFNDLMINLQQEVLDAKDKYPDNIFLQSLYAESDVKYNFIKTSNFKNKPASYKKDLARGWQDLHNVEPLLSHKLLKYSFLTTNFSFGSSAFFEFAPPALILKTMAAAPLIKKNNLAVDPLAEEFAQVYYGNNIYEVTNIARDPFDPTPTKPKFQKIDNAKYGKDRIIKVKDDWRAPFYRVNKKLYKRIKDSQYYELIPTLGYYSDSGRIYDNRAYSLISDNHLPVITKDQMDNIAQLVNSAEFIDDAPVELEEEAPTMDQRKIRGDEAIMSPVQVEEHTQYMEKRFADAGVKVKILYDTNIEVSGQVLGTSHTTYQELEEQGEIESGTHVIVFNPNKLYSDTVFHEFGHIFIDLIGGTRNERVQQALEQLEGSELEALVKEKYPELSGENLQKEIITTALGEEATNLFENKAKQSTWQKFVMWFRNMINRILGLDTDQVTELATEFLNFGKGHINSNTVATETFFQKEAYEANQRINNDLRTLAGIRQQAISTLAIQIKLIKDKLVGEPSEDEKVLKQVEKFEKVKDALEDLDKTEDAVAIREYLSFIRERLKLIDSFLERHDEAIHENEDINTSKVFLRALNEYRKVLDAYRLVNDLHDAFDKGYFRGGEQFVDKDFQKDVERLTAALDSKIKSQHNKLVNASINSLVNVMTPFSSKERVLAEEKYNKQYNKLSKEEKAKESLESYIQRNIAENMKEIESDERKRLRRTLQDSSVDIPALAAWVQGEKDINNQLIQVLSKIIDEADLKRNQFIIDMKIKAEQAYKELKKINSSSNPEVAYKGFYEKGSDGNLYITSKYSVEFIIEYNKLKEALAKAEEIGKESTEYKEALAALGKFRKNNIRGGIPTKKWLNADYASRKDSPLLQFLIDTTKLNNRKLSGQQSNIITFGEFTEFYKAPLKNKEGFEELSSGHMLHTLWENIQSVYKKRADDTEYGQNDAQEGRRKKLMKEIKSRLKAGEDITELQDELNALAVLSNEIGDLKNQIPIFFRGQHNLKTQSFDLVSLLVMDGLMAENFHQKMRIKDTVEMLSAVVDDIKIDRTSDADQKVLVRMVGEKTFEALRSMDMKGNSNIAKVMHSIIENRMYGVKTISTQFAPLARSLMKWTAMTMLGINYTAAGANILQGKMMNFIEAFAGNHFDTKDLAKAEAQFFGDMGGILGDFGKTVPKGKTSLLMDLFNINGTFSALANKYNEDNRFKALFKSNAIFAGNTIGEYYINATLMYAMLNGIKAKNANGEYINSAGTVVSKEKAMSISDAFSVKDGKLVLNEHVDMTSFGTSKFSLNLEQDKGLLEVRNLINKTAIDLYGSYDPEVQAMAQRHVWFKMVQMLRKWLIPGVNRRWRGISTARRHKNLLRDDVDRYYSEDKQSFDEGTYVSFIRFMTSWINDFRRLGFQMAYKHNLNELTQMEKQNIRRTLMEMGMIALTFVMSVLGFKMLDGIDEDDDEMLLYYTFFSRRLFNELSFYVNPLATFEILQSPAATVSFIENTTRLMSQFVEDSVYLVQGEGLEIYERGRWKGYPKLLKRTAKVVPLTSTLSSSIAEKTSYTVNLEK